MTDLPINGKEINSRSKKKETGPIIWGRRERMFVLLILVVTVFSSSIFALVSHASSGLKLPSFSEIKIELPKFDTSQTVVLENEKKREIDYIALEDRLVKKVKGLKSTYAVWVIDIEADREFGFNNLQKIEGASLFKLPLMIAIYKDIDEGLINLDDAITGTTYKDLLDRMGKHSDNQAFLTLLKKYGSKKVNEVTAEIGMTDTSFNKSTTTAGDMALLFEKLMKGELISDTSREKLLDNITDTDYEQFIAAGVPENIKVSHKYGREVGVLNDVGVVFSERPFIISIMTEDTNEFEVTEVIPEITEIVYNEVGQK